MVRIPLAVPIAGGEATVRGPSVVFGRKRNDLAIDWRQFVTHSGPLRLTELCRRRSPCGTMFGSLRWLSGALQSPDAINGDVAGDAHAGTPSGASESTFMRGMRGMRGMIWP